MSLVYKLRSQFAECEASEGEPFLGFLSHVTGEWAEGEMFAVILIKTPVERKHVDTRMLDALISASLI